MTADFYKDLHKKMLKKARVRKNYEDVNEKTTFADLAVDKHELYRGYLFWPKDKNPESWGGPFVDKNDENWVGFSIKNEKFSPFHGLKSIVEIHEANKEYNKRTRFNYPDEALKRAGMDPRSDYWNRPYLNQICSFSEMTDEELEKVHSVMTPLEKIRAEMNIARHLSGEMKDTNPFLIPSVENYIRVYLHGNDDCSYSITGNFEQEDEDYNNFYHQMVRFLVSPSWYEINSFSSRWYFSN